MPKINGNEIRPGTIIEHDGGLWASVKVNHVKPGKGGAYIGLREDTVAAFEQLVSAGKIRSWGVSNFDVDDLDEMLEVAGEGRIACNQVLYHLQERAIEHAVIPWCRKHGTAVVAYSPFGHDDFPGPQSRAGAVLQTIAEAHGGSVRVSSARGTTDFTLVFPQVHIAQNGLARA